MGDNGKCRGCKTFRQIGQVALREPGTGEMLPAVKLYVRESDAAAMPDTALLDIGSLLGRKFSEYAKKEAAARGGVKKTRRIP
jgi:hypothetical protein